MLGSFTKLGVGASSSSGDWGMDVVNEKSAPTLKGGSM